MLWLHHHQCPLCCVSSCRHLLFRVDGDRGEGLASCATLLPEGVGRPLVLATRRHGLVEGEACLLLPEVGGMGMCASVLDGPPCSQPGGGCFSHACCTGCLLAWQCMHQLALPPKPYALFSLLAPALHYCAPACCAAVQAAASGAEEALSPVSDAGSAQRGSLFSRLIDQLFDQTRHVCLLEGGLMAKVLEQCLRPAIWCLGWHRIPRLPLAASPCPWDVRRGVVVWQGHNALAAQLM